jgi:hypothetical protein
LALWKKKLDRLSDPSGEWMLGARSKHPVQIGERIGNINMRLKRIDHLMLVEAKSSGQEAKASVFSVCRIQASGYLQNIIALNHVIIGLHPKDCNFDVFKNSLVFSTQEHRFTWWGT